MTEIKRLSTVKAAKVLGVTSQTLKNWRREGKGPAYYQMGGCVFYYQTDLDEYLSGCRVDPK